MRPFRRGPHHGPHTDRKPPERRQSDRLKLKTEESRYDSGAETATMEEAAAMIAAAEPFQEIPKDFPADRCILCKEAITGKQYHTVTLNGKAIKVHSVCPEKKKEVPSAN